MWHFTNNLRLDYIDTSSIEEMFDHFCKGVSLYGPFWNHVLDYWGKSIEKPKEVIFLMYEEIKEQPKIQLKCLVEFLEFSFSIEEENCGVKDKILRMCSFENLTNLDENINGKLSTGEETKMFFCRGEVGDWKHYFTLGMSVIACQQQFQAQDNDIILITSPKSGTVWLKSLLIALVNRNNHPIFEKDHPLLLKNAHDLILFLELDLYADGQVLDFSSFTSPRLLATHVPFASLPKSVQNSRTKLVYLCRNPRDTFISMWNFANNLRLDNHKDTNFIEEMFDHFC
ncbi:hypothetical protein H5410_027520 [Solanum commersonii]|uniref:Sulfotransferase n=1 Tax=Solanum commersonii TaxID=4109 RepID=A0A9J5Z3L2_SOLCO|nr:hypothetical protein H5410_027520 [Solanum commersonii]